MLTRNSCHTIGFDVSLSRSNIDVISQFVALVDAAHHPIEPLASILGLTPNFMQWFSTAVMENTCARLPIRAI